jgi:pimeloyl-ACP methyl ester carboxylesterase
VSLFVPIPGAGGSAWYWHRVVPELRARGHEAVAVDLPGANESAGLGTGIDVVPGGHLAALSRPAELAGQLASYL